MTQGAVAGKVQGSKEASGLVSGNQRGFMQHPRGLLTQSSQSRCLSFSVHIGHAATPLVPLKQPTLTGHQALGSTGVLHMQRLQGPLPSCRPMWAVFLGPRAWPWTCPHLCSLCPDHGSCSFRALVFTCWLGGCITHSWFITLDPGRIKPLGFCWDTRCSSASSFRPSLPGSWCLCSNT